MDVPFLSLKDLSKKYEDEIKNAINRVVNSGWYLQGVENQEFEKEYSKFIGTKYCVTVGNGLEALELMLRAYIEIGVLHQGDEIIVPANTYIATIMAITKNKLVPILVEPKYNSLEIDDSRIEEFITSKTKGLMIVHLYGRCAYTYKIQELCSKYNLLLFEDNAQAHGCKFNGKRTGALGDCAGHSFYPGKNLGALGDAGAITTNNKEIADVVRALGNYGSAKKYVFEYLGENSRMDEIQAAILRVKLAHLDDDNGLRISKAKMYYKGINNTLITLPDLLNDDENVYHLFPILTSKRDQLQTYLSEKGIHTLIHYPIPPHKQRAYRNWNNLSFPITEKIHMQELSLPIGPTISDTDIEYIISMINGFTANE